MIKITTETIAEGLSTDIWQISFFPYFVPWTKKFFWIKPSCLDIEKREKSNTRINKKFTCGPSGGGDVPECPL